MQPDKQRVASNFSTHAGTYEQQAAVQEHMAQRLMEALCGLHHAPRSILDIGCGTGLLTGKLATAFPGADITAVDLAAGMLEQAATKLRGHRVQLVRADIEEHFPPQPFDLVASSATFQWVVHPGALVQRCRHALQPGGMFLLATFGEEMFRELRDAFEHAAQSLRLDRWHYPGPAFHSAQQWKDWTGYAFGNVQVTEERVTQHHASVRQFLKSVQAMGAGNGMAAPQRHHVALLRRVMDIYQQHADANAMIPVTYHVVYCVARVEA